VDGERAGEAPLRVNGLLAAREPTLRPAWLDPSREPRAIDGVVAPFKEKAVKSGYGPTATIARIIRRYLNRGFDDGGPETRDDSTIE
jgi:hypothetical protein